ncbi:MAG TPA: riboflavin synthase [Dehalococcoidia bacterium]|nr:riboflavin synthase [Dehalococcoidia bacterium]
MFTGIVEEVGEVLEADKGRLRIGSRKCLRGTNLGDSIAVNGVDLTVAYMDEESFHFNVMQETYSRSNLSTLQPGDPVNLERSLTLSTKISGHLVRGVVEATGELLSMETEKPGPQASGNAVIARYGAPPNILRYVVVKGPITVDGVSLTVIARDEQSFSVSLVEYTQANTNLTRRQPGERVNLETDIIARYVEQLLAERAGENAQFEAK